MAVSLKSLAVCSTLTWVWMKTVLSGAKSYKGLCVPMFWCPKNVGFLLVLNNSVSASRKSAKL